MPGFDGTGPMGKGPRTGGGRGFCLLEQDTKSCSRFYPLGGYGYGYYPYGGYTHGLGVGYGGGRGGFPRGCGRGRSLGGRRW